MLMNKANNDIGEFSEPLALEVGKSIKDRRIDKYLHGRFSNFSRAMIQKQIAAGSVKVNDKVVKASFKLSAADKIELILPQLPSKEIEPEEIDLILFTKTTICS